MNDSTAIDSPIRLQGIITTSSDYLVTRFVSKCFSTWRWDPSSSPPRNIHAGRGLDRGVRRLVQLERAMIHCCITIDVAERASAHFVVKYHLAAYYSQVGCEKLNSLLVQLGFDYTVIDANRLLVACPGWPWTRTDLTVSLYLHSTVFRRKSIHNCSIIVVVIFVFILSGRSSLIQARYTQYKCYRCNREIWNRANASINSTRSHYTLRGLIIMIRV